MSSAATLSGRFRDWLKDASIHRKLAYALAVAAVISGVATFATMTGRTSTDIKIVLNLIYVDGILLLLLALVVARRITTVWQERRRGQAGAGLHVRLVMLFSLVAVTPAILVAVFAALFINYGLSVWFSDRISTAINQSLTVSHAYLDEHRKNIVADAFVIANDINFNASLIADPRQIGQILSHHAAIRALSEALVIDGSGRVMARSEFSFSVRVDGISAADFEQVNRGEIAIIGNRTDERIRALIKLANIVDAYLVIERFVDPQVIAHIKRVEDAVGRYQTMEQQRSGIQISFVMIFVVVALLLLLAAIWIGLTVSTQLAKPISSLISAAERVSQGDLSVRVDTADSVDEIGALSRAFNDMTSELKSSQEGLIDANRELDERRRFTETVLAGVSAGVIGLDKDGRIHLSNRSASELLATNLENDVGKPLADVVPEMALPLEQAISRPDRQQHAELNVARDGRFRTLKVSIAAERLSGDVFGYVVTFDDVSELLSAQRKAAWSDVARRIAHEIKNPLTPIQLSAERLKRKYLKEIKTDPETFLNCTETIVRQVEDLHRMVDEFSSFARMPQIVPKNENLAEICRGTVMLETNRHPDIFYDLAMPQDDVRLYCDHRQVSRALTNLLKNAAESIIARDADDDGGAAAPRGTIRVSVVVSHGDGGNEENRDVRVVVEDNGRGLPAQNREQLTEPYVTTRTKGTGLGLAIVKKIMEDHNGHLLLEDRDGGGAKVTLVFRPFERNLQTAPGAQADQDPMKVATSLLAQGS
jgi:two-component system, NtrC family, nitrogen regulation sensor histidine kinase NtrY